MKSIENLNEHVKNGKRLMHELAKKAAETESFIKFEDVEVTLPLKRYNELKGGIL